MPFQNNCFHNDEYMDNITQLGQPDDIIASFCSKIFQEALLIERFGFPMEFRDLFTEQGLYILPFTYRAQNLKKKNVREMISGQHCLQCYQLTISLTFFAFKSDNRGCTCSKYSRNSTKNSIKILHHPTSTRVGRASSYLVVSIF